VTLRLRSRVYRWYAHLRGHIHLVRKRLQARSEAAA